jgi:hypothetical protein
MDKFRSVVEQYMGKKLQVRRQYSSTAQLAPPRGQYSSPWPIAQCSYIPLLYPLTTLSSTLNLP